MNTAFATVFYKILALLMSAYTLIGGGLQAPSTEAVISALRPDEVKMTAVFWGDTQVSDYMLSRQLYVKNACLDVANSAQKIDALIHVGDIAENGKASEYKLVEDDFAIMKDTVDNYVIAVGNHDVRMRAYCQVKDTFSTFCNDVDENLTVDSLYYTRDINGYKLIVLGPTKTAFEESYISDEEVEWLDNQLAGATAEGKPALVILHQPLKWTHGLPETWGSPIPGRGSVGYNSDELKQTLAKYENVFLLTGHLHSGFGEFTYEEYEGIHCINTPSVGIRNGNGVTDRGLGFVIEVYENEIVFRARNFAAGKWMPEYDRTYPLV